MGTVLRPSKTKQAPIVGLVNANDAESLRRSIQSIASIIDHPVYEVEVAWGDQATLTRNLTLQVRDRRNNPLSGRFEILWYLTDTDGGAPVNTQTVGAPTAGSFLETITPDSVFASYTDSTGKFTVPVTLSAGGSSRVAMPGVRCRLDSAVGRAAAWA